MLGRLLAILALLLLAPAAAQVPGPLYTVKVTGVQPLEPGSTATMKMLVTRECASMASVLPEQSVEISFRMPPGVLVAGPRTVNFAQRACAGAGGDAVELLYDVGVTPDAERGRSHIVGAMVRPQFTGNPAMQSGSEAAVDFLVTVPHASKPPGAALGSTMKQESPSPAAAVLVMALLGAAAFVARRRE